MADGHHPGQQVAALNSAGQLVGSVGVGGAAAAVVAGVVGGDRRPHMNYRRPRVSKYILSAISIKAPFLINKLMCHLHLKN